MADVAAVQGLWLIRLRHGNPAVPSDLGDVVAKPDDLQLDTSASSAIALCMSA
jgi:hypothetical protein